MLRDWQAWQITLDQLALQRDRRGGHNHCPAGLDGMTNARHEIRERLPGSGARLHG